MLTGWQIIDSKWYYFNVSGVMEKDTWIGDYYVDEKGVWDTSKVKRNGSLAETAGGIAMEMELYESLTGKNSWPVLLF